MQNIFAFLDTLRNEPPGHRGRISRGDATTATSSSSVASLRPWRRHRSAIDPRRGAEKIFTTEAQRERKFEEVFGRFLVSRYP
jgi:hypothetical protein